VPDDDCDEEEGPSEATPNISQRAASDNRVQATGEVACLLSLFSSPEACYEWCFGEPQMADKLDVLMEEMFGYFESSFKALPRTVSSDDRDHLFHVILAVFERSILLTHKWVVQRVAAHRPPSFVT
jgi:hypothetical protein